MKTTERKRPAAVPFSVAATDFHPRRFLSNGHLQTILGNFLPRAGDLPAAESLLVEVAPPQGRSPADEDAWSRRATARASVADDMPAIGSRVLCECHWQPDEVRAEALTVILVHGLEGSSHSQYVLGNARKLLRAGCNVVRMNMRNCGGTEALSPTLYHSGLSNDVLAVMRFFIARDGLQRLALVGYSMGGNLVLKLAGELGQETPGVLRAVAGISPAIDLGLSADALHRPLNRLYERRFLRALLARYRRKAAIFPKLFESTRAAGIHSIREFDDRITAPYSGFADADDYYFRASSARVLSSIAVPTLVLHALDDPFVKLSPESHEALRRNPQITVLEPQHGGHCAFLARPDPAHGDDGYWAEQTVARFLLAHS